MIVSVTDKAAEAEGALSYPVLMECTQRTDGNTALIVLFTGPCEGIRVQSGSNKFALRFRTEDDWIEASNAHHWKKYTGSITMRNE